MFVPSVGFQTMQRTAFSGVPDLKFKASYPSFFGRVLGSKLIFFKQLS